MTTNYIFLSKGQAMLQKANKMNSSLCCSGSSMDKALAFENAAKQLKVEKMLGEASNAYKVAADAYKSIGEDMKAAVLYEEAIHTLEGLQLLEHKEIDIHDKNIQNLIQNAKICYLRAGESFSAANILLNAAVNDSNLMREAMEIFLNEKSPMHAIQALEKMLILLLQKEEYKQAINVLKTMQNLYQKVGIEEKKHDQLLLQKALLFKLIGDYVGLQQQQDQISDENSSENQLITALINDNFSVVDELSKEEYLKFILQAHFVVILKKVKEIVLTNEEEKNRDDVCQVQEIL